MTRRLAPMLAALTLLALPAAAAAQCPRTTLGEVEAEVMCPVCGTPLALATEAPQAQRERELIRRLVDDCRSKDEIKDVLVDEFGENVLALPGDDGFGLAAYLVPGLALLLGGGALGAAALRWRRARRLQGGDEATVDATPAPGGAAAKRLQSDLERYEL